VSQKKGVEASTCKYVFT